MEAAIEKFDLVLINAPYLDSSPDRLLVNGPCLAEGAEAIEPVFKGLMFAGVA